MCDVCVFFDQFYLIFVNEAIYVAALFDETCSQELSLLRRKTNKQIENDHDQKVCFMWAGSLGPVYSIHDIISLSVYSNKFEYGARNISHILKPSEHLPE